MKVKVWLPLAVLWALMSVFGIAVHETTERRIGTGELYVSVAGLDGDVYLRRYCDLARSLHFRKRHPGEIIITAPFYVVSTSITDWAGERPAKIALILMAAALGVFTVYLLWLVTADLGAVALWVSFVWVWLLAGAPELFAISQAVLIGTLLMVRRGVTDLRKWGVMTLLAGGATITNVVKPIAAFLLTSGQGGKLWRFVKENKKTFVIAIVVVLAVFVVLEIVRWTMVPGLSFSREIHDGWDYITYWSSGGFPFVERVRRIWEMFILEPMMTHGAIFGYQNEGGIDILPLGYRLPIPHLVGAAIVCLCGWSAWKNRRDAVVIAALAMVSFDILLHIVIGWGLLEAQIYCGHWLYVIPVLLSGVKGRNWKFALAAVIAAWNLSHIEAFL